jgi:hypothetical protein
MIKKVMPDLNAWLDFFKDRKTSRYRFKILEAFQHDAVFITGMIYTQLLGSMPLDTLPRIKESLQGLNMVEFAVEDYGYAGEVTAYLLDRKITSIPSLIPLHARYCELHDIEYLSEAYDNGRITIDTAVIEMVKDKSAFRHFKFDEVNERVYLGSGYMDPERTRVYELPENTLFQNSCCCMDYIHARSRKYLEEAEVSGKYSLYGFEGDISIIDKEYIEKYNTSKKESGKKKKTVRKNQKNN